jgi:alkaline phosphatase D
MAMRIAFGSCSCISALANQPTWDWIRAANPEHLLLLGDLIYLDIGTSVHPKKMSDPVFADHLLHCYRKQLGQAQFAKLIAHLGAGRVHATWDDHDFLWDDACGAAVAADPMQASKIPLSLWAHHDLRVALGAGLGLAGFPTASTAWFATPAPEGPSQSLQLQPDLWLHMLDSRLHRDRTSLGNQGKRQLIGSTQRRRVGKLIENHADAIHLLAIGSTSADWKHYEQDWLWLMSTAAKARCLLVSGDIHRNECDAFNTGGWPLHEVTSSGTAIKSLVVAGSKRFNHGLIDIDANHLSWSLYSKGVVDAAQSRRLLRSSWLPV